MTSQIKFYNKSLIYQIFNFFFILLLILNFFKIFNSSYQASYPTSGSDHEMYFDTIINLLENNIHSYDKDNVEKSFYRDPLYPFLVSLFFKFRNSNFNSLDKCKYDHNKNDEDCISILKSIGQFNKVNYLCFFLLVLLIAKKLFDQKFAFISFLILFNPLYEDQIILVFTELISTSLFLIYCFLLFLICTRQNKIIFYTILCSIIFAALILTKSVYFYLNYIYFFICSIFFIFFLFYKIGFLKTFYLKFNLKILILHSLLALILIMPWQLRNVAEFGEYKISDRSSGVLSLRAEVFDINWAEYFHGYKYWMPDSKIRNYLITENDYLSIKYNDIPDNIHAWWNRHDKTYGYVLSRIDLSNIKTNPIITKESLLVFKENILLNIPLSLLFFYKSLFIEFESILIYKIITWLLPLIFVYFVLIDLIRKQNYSYLFFYLPTIYHIAMYSFFTYYEPRYNLLIIPTMWFSIFLFNLKK